ncbi:MAG: efflux RND transporter periplasmic adaptor subunit [Deltaproteobacteria bacterium]
MALLSSLSWAYADPFTLGTTTITEWKAVYGRVEARDQIPARARLGGVLAELSVVEGDFVEAGQELARIVDDKIAFQLAALAAQKDALAAQSANAETDLKRSEDLLKSGTTTAQRVDALRTQVDVLKGQMAALDAQSEIITQQEKEGRVLAPVAGRVLDVPLAKGAVVMPGEAVAIIAGGGTFLRIAVPERHAASLKEGAKIQISDAAGDSVGTLSRIYPLIENGRVVADVVIDGLSDTFIGARMLVRLPLGTRDAFMVPAPALVTRAGLDFIALDTPDGVVLRSVVPGQHQMINGTEMIEIISGLRLGDSIMPSGEAAK